MPTPNIPRLTRVVRVLEALPETQGFDLGSFANISHACGTTACALGYAALDPILMAEGFRLAWVKGRRGPTTNYELVRFIESVEDFNSLSPTDIGRSWFIALPEDRIGELGAGASLEFFGINGNQFYAHFMGGGYTMSNPTPRDVAAKLRETFGIAT